MENTSRRISSVGLALAISALALPTLGQVMVLPSTKPAATTAPATSPSAAPAKVAVTSPATAPATAPSAATAPAATNAATAKLPAVDQLLPKDPVTLNFDNVTIKDALDVMADKYGFKLQNAYDFMAMPDKENASERPMRITLVNAKMTARQAINLMNGTLLTLGYTLNETVVKGDPPKVVITVLQSGRDTTKIQVFFGTDPAEIPKGDEIRSQVMTLVNVTPAEAKEDIETVLGKTDIEINESAKQLVITDTAANVHQAAATLQLLEKESGKETESIKKFNVPRASRLNRVLQTRLKLER